MTGDIVLREISSLPTRNPFSQRVPPEFASICLSHNFFSKVKTFDQSGFFHFSPLLRETNPILAMGHKTIKRTEHEINNGNRKIQGIYLSVLYFNA